jgi:hypothetical protein
MSSENKEPKGFKFEVETDMSGNIKKVRVHPVFDTHPGDKPKDPDPIVDPDPVEPDPVDPDPIEDPDPVDPDPIIVDPVEPDPDPVDPEDPEDPIDPEIPDPELPDPEDPEDPDPIVDPVDPDPIEDPTDPDPVEPDPVDPVEPEDPVEPVDPVLPATEPASISIEMFNPNVEGWTSIRRLTFPSTYQVLIRPVVHDAQGTHLPEWDAWVTWRVHRDDADTISIDKNSDTTALITAKASDGTFRMYAELIREGYSRISTETRPHVQRPLFGFRGFYVPYADHQFPTTEVTLPSTIDATGATDVTVELNNWLATVPNNSVVVFPENGLFNIEGTVLIAGKEDLYFEGNESRFISRVAEPFASGSSANRNRAHITVDECHRIVFNRLNVTGPNTNRSWVASLEAQHCFNVRRSSDVIISNCELTEAFGDGVYVASGTNRIKIRNNHIHHIGRQGIAVVQGHDVLIKENRIGNIRRGIIDLEPNSGSGHIYRVRIEKNLIGSHHLQFLPAGGGPAYVEFVEVVDNVFEDGGYLRATILTPEYHLGYVRNNFVFLRNVSTKKADRRAIVINRMTDLVAKDNIQPGSNRGHYFIEGRGCNIVSENNQIDGFLGDMDVSPILGVCE